MAPSGSSGTAAGDADPEMVGTVPLMLHPPPELRQNLLAGVVKVELALPSLARTSVKLMYCDPVPSLGAPAAPAPGTVPCQLLPSEDVITYSCTIGWPLAGSRLMRLAKTWSPTLSPDVVAASDKLLGFPAALTRLPLVSSQIVDGLAVGGNAAENAGGATPITDAPSGARSELCCDTWWAPTRSIQSTTTASRFVVCATSPHAM